MAGAAAESEVPAVELDQVTFGYDRAPVLADVTLRIRQGDRVGIVGPNGGGKTTLLRLILGLLRPDQGVVRVFGEAPQRAHRRIGYVPQTFRYDAAFPISAMEVVLMGRLGLGMPLGPYRRGDRGAALEALDGVGLADSAHKAFADLSGGQRQRVLIARALASGPEMLVLDEPTASVDPAAEREIYDLLRGLCDRMTIIMVSHDLRFVSELVHGVLCVAHGVNWHPTTAVGELTSELFRELYGADVRLVRHDRHYEAEETR